MPDQLLSFDDFNLSEPIRRALTEMGFEAPTEVQSASFQPILDGKDLAIQARTGTGKTAAFSIPLADRLLGEERKVQLLVLCPTRELALQVAAELSNIGKHRGLEVAPVYGGAALTKQIRQLEEGVHAVVGTPGRTLDHIRRRTLDVRNVRYLVLDEADEMLSMGFEKEISAIIEQLPEQRQTMLLSATIPNEIQRLSQRYMNEPTVLSLSDDYVGAKEIEHAFYMVSGTGRLADLIRIIDVEDPDSALVFCNTRDDVQMVANGLRRFGFNVEWISSDLSQSEREAAMSRMRDDDVRFLVATDVAARGIDISHVTHVINYTFPESLEIYIHRTGRTGRMGRTGWAISLITPRDVGNLYFLKLQYRITPLERELPTQGEVAARQECDVLTKLLTDHQGQVSATSLSLARRLLHHVRGTEIIANLLESVLGSLDAGEAEKTRRRRPGRMVSPLVETDEGERRPRTPRRTRSAQVSPPPELPTREAPEQVEFDEAPPPEQAPFETREQANEESLVPPLESGESDPSDPSDLRDPADSSEETLDEPTADDEEDGDGTLQWREIYVSVGRRDGVRPGEIARILEEHGVKRDQVDRIRVRDRSTFVGVREHLTETAVAALDGVKIGDRVATAELAKRVRT